MALNQLLFNHQLAMMIADGSGSIEDRDRAHNCAGKITDWRLAKGLPIIGWPRDQRTRDCDALA